MYANHRAVWRFESRDAILQGVEDSAHRRSRRDTTRRLYDRATLFSPASIPVKLFSKDETFFDYFRQLAEHIGSAANLLKTLLEDPAKGVSIAAEIKRVETEGDAIVYVINQRIDTSFVTPLDREDIHQLAKRLDNVIDIINGAARRVVMFRVTDRRDGAVRAIR